MAETAKRSNTTDKLVIDIKVNVKKGATTQITNLTKSLTKLNEVVKNTANIEKYANALRTIGKEVTRTTSNKGISKVQGNANLLETTEANVGKQKQQTKEIQKQEQTIKNITKEKQKQSKLDKDANKENKKSSTFFSKFAKSIGRIALYRAIRAGLSAIVKSAKEGLNYFVQYDDATNKAMSNITNAGNQIKATLGVTVGDLLTSLEPIITRLSDAVIGLLDNINKAMALMQGDKSYKKAIKNNKDYADSLKETNNQLLSFDKFESLNKAEDKQDYEDIAITEDEADAISPLTEVLTKVKETLGEVWDTIKYIIKELEPVFRELKPIILDILNTASDILQDILPTIKNIVKVLSPILAGALNLLNPLIRGISDWLESVVNFVVGVIDFIVGIISGFIKLITGDFEGAWEDIANGFASMINGIVNFFVGFVNFFIGAINALIKPIDWIVQAFGGRGLQIPEISWRMDWQPYADGGMVEKGTRFIAGEAGAEVVHTSARGTGVTNIEQFSQAMLQALATYGVARGSDVSFKGDVYIDRTKAGQLLEGSVFGEGVRVGHFKRV